MKQITGIHRIGLGLNAALLTLSLSLLASTPTVRLARDHDGKLIHPILRSGATPALGNNSGLKVDMWWWLRRWG
jgi:hypothetical protein